jgi:pseudouridine-5'-monophosphatase
VAAVKRDGRLRAVIYDLDGVLLDTEHFYTEATQEIVAEFGKTFDWAVKGNMIGRPSLESARYLVETLHLPITAQEYLERRRRRLEDLFPTARPCVGAVRFTEAVRAQGIPQGVATSSERALFDLKVTNHRAWFEVFATVVTGDDPRVARGKPAPDSFLVAADDLGVLPTACLVFEDAPAGVAAARSAGMRVIAIPDPAMDRARYAEADRVIASFDEITPADVGLTR